ncbi:protein of unknown function [Bradyrhizobium vignae]|uniref:Uncharacterized protein n=1 Tax=Bradyrhizobium vignae TaxID=1549949 RepID=A0A2U3PRS7_9BRAD|nr:protein of unknown function [Bradyrhizobium vignae]
MPRSNRGVAASFTSPEGRGRIASLDAMRVSGYAHAWERRPLTRAFGATSPRWGEVRDAARPSPRTACDRW